MLTVDRRTPPALAADSTAASDLRPAGRCPLCAAPTRPLDRFEFAPKPGLPDVVVLEFCADCDFLFVGDVSASSYRRYYASVANDANHVGEPDAPDSDVRLQVAHIADVLPADFDGRVLDFGCGQGRLLRALASRFERASLHGHDVADYLPPTSRIAFLPTIDDVAERFDLIVLSHVAEHLVGFEVLATLERLLAPGGLLYIEVPDPRGYASCPRRENMYYIDRLHINHFSARALGRLLARFGLVVRARGTHRFRYRDGLYPAAYCVASRPQDRATVPAGDDVDASDPSTLLDAVYRDYRDDERRRAGALRATLATEAESGLLVYGAGDNFARARAPWGPLHGLPLLGVMDQRAGGLLRDDGPPVEFPDVALARHAHAAVAITVSQRSDEIVQRIREFGADRRIFLI